MRQARLRRCFTRHNLALTAAVLLFFWALLSLGSSSSSSSPYYAAPDPADAILRHDLSKIAHEANAKSSSSSRKGVAPGHHKSSADLAEIAYRGASHDFPIPDPHARARDMIDAFAGYANRDQCPVSSLQLHRPFEPLCRTKAELLTAMSDGGRIGMDAPYMPRGCDMRWFDRGEICEILSRYDKVLFVGDSMMRHAVGALHVLMREDLGFGGVTQWNFRLDEKEACFCDGQFDTLKCGLQGIFNSDDVAKFDLQSLKCDARKLNVQNHVMTTYPPSSAELAGLGDALAQQSSGRPVALIYSQGHHNDLDVSATSGWITSIQRTISERMKRGVGRAQLFVTPGASGPQMIDRDLIKHGVQALQKFEIGMREIGHSKDLDVLGTWNATVQSTLIDGKHSGIKGNLLKIMMVLNWLDKVTPVEASATKFVLDESQLPRQDQTDVVADDTLGGVNAPIQALVPPKGKAASSEPPAPPGPLSEAAAAAPAAPETKPEHAGPDESDIMIAKTEEQKLNSHIDIAADAEHAGSGAVPAQETIEKAKEQAHDGSSSPVAGKASESKIDAAAAVAAAAGGASPEDTVKQAGSASAAAPKAASAKNGEESTGGSASDKSSSSSSSDSSRANAAGIAQSAPQSGSREAAAAGQAAGSTSKTTTSDDAAAAAAAGVGAPPSAKKEGAAEAAAAAAAQPPVKPQP
ncbi:hypothetical protein BZA70DRAFT_291653 [Myxozyma melibiosi]|uniref:SGNH domain-containing protein n=1 Tax=Myxozyma melibiosi TaxID=54550 RepID=A0ABR1F282_9ASCO